MFLAADCLLQFCSQIEHIHYYIMTPPLQEGQPVLFHFIDEAFKFHLIDG